MTTQLAVSLGQEAFVLTSEGGVIRTMVAKLRKDSYCLLNGWHSGSRHWLTFDEAVAVADARIRERQTALRKELQVLVRKRKELVKTEYKEEVMRASYKVVDLQERVRATRSRHLKVINVPEEYMNPGHLVYVVITPTTLPRDYVYRPHRCFVLETSVSSVCFSPDGVVHYAIASPFEVTEHFQTRKAATANLRSVLRLTAEDPVPFVSKEEEEQELAKIDDVPF